MSETTKVYDRPVSVVGGEGVETGDIIRWNDSTGEWEVKSEPFEFKGIVLTPALAALADTLGGMYFNSSTKSVMVCTEV